MQFLADPRLIRAARILFWLALVFAVTMAVMPRPPHLPIDRFGDKFAHTLAFATLAALAAVSFPAAIRWRVAERLCFLGALIEVIQSIPALHRDCDIRDWLVDAAAVVVVTFLAGRLIDRSRSA